MQASSVVRGIGLAVRTNPRRLHLIVTPALAKHVPVAPEVASVAAEELARRIVALPDAPTGTSRPDLVIGLAETATGLARLVADRLGEVDYIHSTRMDPLTAGRPSSGVLSFDETHSHARTHQLRPSQTDLFTRCRNVVIVDDELTSAATIAGLIEQLARVAPLTKVVIACLIDARRNGPDLVPDVGHRLGIEVRVVTLVRLALALPEEADRPLIVPNTPRTTPRRRTPATVLRFSVPWRGPADRDGLRLPSTADEDRAVRVAAGFLGLARAHRGVVHVIGIEEQIALPVKVGHHLGQQGVDAVVSSTTRSPVLVVDDEDYPIRDALILGTPAYPRYLYNPVRDAAAALVIPDTDNVIHPRLLAELGQISGCVAVVHWLQEHRPEGLS